MGSQDPWGASRQQHFMYHSLELPLLPQGTHTAVENRLNATLPSRLPRSSAASLLAAVLILFSWAGDNPARCEALRKTTDFPISQPR